MPKGSTKLTEADKSELKDLIISDRSSISTAISNFMRIKDIALTSQDVRNVINGWENRCLNGLELQIGGTIGVSAQGQFAALIHNLSFDPNLVVFIHYKVKDSSNCVISSFNQIYFNIGNERKNVLLKGNSINFNVFKLIFQEQECTVHENEGLEEMDISQGNFMPMTVSWCSLDQLQRNSRYCEVVMLDATGGTNSQKRPVVMIVSMDGEMKNTCLLTTITVDETSSSFMRILQAFRMIYGRDVCNRIKTFFSDGDEQITGSIDSNISYYNRQHARTFGTHTDGRNESENKALKQFQINPRTKLSSIYYADSVRQTIRTISCDRRDNFVQHTIPLIDKEKKKELHIDTIEK